MDSGFYAACAGLVAKTEQLEVLAHNLANAGTTAFKSKDLSFRSLLASANSSLSDLNQAINSYGVTSNPTVNMLPGTIERTGSSLNIAIEGPAFMSIRTGKEVRFTRDGHLQLSATGQLVTQAGDLILGDQGPITLPPGAAITISAEGDISANGALVGRLKLVEFDPAAPLVQIAPGLFTTNATPHATTTSKVRQGALETSNVNGVEAAVNLIALQRHAEMLQRTMSIFHSEFNRIAASDLPRV